MSTTGLERHYRNELHLGLAAGRAVQECLAMAGGIGIADGKFVAEAAASWAYPGCVLVVPTGAERYFLQHLPVSLLPLAEEGQRQLRLLAATFTWAGRVQRVARVCNAWRVHTGWWQQEVWRDYFKVQTENGLLCTVYHDLLADRWHLVRIYD